MRGACGGCAPARSARARAVEASREHDLETAPQLRVARALERAHGRVTFEVELALAARTAALLPPFAEQGPAAEQVLLEHDLVIARRVGSDRPGLHEDSHGRIVPGARRLHRAPGRRGAAAGSRA